MDVVFVLEKIDDLTVSRKSIKGQRAVKSGMRQKPITFAVDYDINGKGFRMDKTN